MKPTTEGSNAINFDMTCMSFEKEREKGLKVIIGAEKNIIFNDEMTITAENSTLRDNNTLETENGTIINFTNNAFKTVEKNRKIKAKNGNVVVQEELLVNKKTTTRKRNTEKSIEK